MTSSQINDQLGAAVRDGVARAAGVVGWRGSGLIHLLDPPSKLNETPTWAPLSAVGSDQRDTRARRLGRFRAEGPTTIVLLKFGLGGWQLRSRRLTPGAGIKGPLCQAIGVARRRCPSMGDEHDAHKDRSRWSARLP